MVCSNCGKQTHGGYCDCMIINGEFKGAWWSKTKVANVEKKQKDKLGGESVMYETYAEIMAEQEMIKAAELENWQIANNIDAWDYEE